MVLEVNYVTVTLQQGFARDATEEIDNHAHLSEETTRRRYNLTYCRLLDITVGSHVAI